MAFPTSAHGSSSGPVHGGSTCAPSGSAPAPARCSAAAGSSSPLCSSADVSGAPLLTRVRGSEGEHRLEKLEFALAVALSRREMARVQQLRDQIDALGGNAEEPGT